MKFLNPENTEFEYGTTTDIIQYPVFPSKRMDKYCTSPPFISIFKNWQMLTNKPRSFLLGRTHLTNEIYNLFLIFIFMSTKTQKIHFSIRDKNNNLQKSELSFEYTELISKEELKKQFYCISASKH